MSKPSAPTPLKIYFLRHGQTEHSRENHFCGAGLNPELTPHGYEMAKSFAEKYASVQWQAIYTSPLQRTISTAELTARTHGLPLTMREQLKEIAYGAWEGQTVEHVNTQHHDDYIRWTADPAWCPPTGGETANEIAHRAMSVVSEIKEKYTHGNVLVVSHKATIRIILCSLLGIDVGRFRFRLDCPVCSLNIVEFTKQGPWLRLLADRSHLPQHLKDLPGT